MTSKHPTPVRLYAEEEDYLHEQLRMLQISYEKAAKPIIDRLVLIRSFDPVPKLIIPIEQLDDHMRAAIARAIGGGV